MTNKKGRKVRKILGIKVDSTTNERVLREIRSYLDKKEKFFVVTPNPEIVMLAQTDKHLAEVINSADISVPDGIGLAAAGKFLELPNPDDKAKRLLVNFAQGLGVGFSVLFDKDWLTQDLKIIKGRDLFLDLIKQANKKGWRAYFLGGKGEEAIGTKKELEKTYKKIEIKADKGPLFDNEARPVNKKEEKKEKKVIEEIIEFKPHLLFVALEFPKQEKWVYRWYKELDIGGAMVVGGTFRYLAGDAKLPPKWLEEKGLEWLWRLLTEPKRAKRIFAAFPKFPLEVFLYKFLGS